jgi:predicted pyridoxine 5'-phosphate oxidase superfamily flavin-nucleotide-binding protein
MGLITREIRDFVNRVKLGFIATVCPDGTPNLSPKGTTIAWDEDYLVFADIHSPGTIDNLRVNSSIEINVVDVFIRKGYRFKGRAEILSDGTLFHEIISYYRAAGSQHVIRNIVIVHVNRIIPILSPAYDTGLTEAQVKNKWVDYWQTVYNISP